MSEGWIRIITLAAALLFAMGPAGTLAAQDDGLTPEQRALLDRPVVRVDIVGLERVSETLVRSNIRTAAGNPYDPRTIALDLSLLDRLGQFKSITPEAELQPDGSVVVTFIVVEQPLLRDVQVVGNSIISDQELLEAIPLIGGVPRSEYLIDTSRRRIKDLYRERGHYKAEVLVDEEELDESGILLFQIIEGPRVRVRAIEFRGNDHFTKAQLNAEVDTETAFFLFRKGQLDQDVIASDVSNLDSFYKDRGYLDVRVGSAVELSPDDKEAKVVFIIQEGRVYTMRHVTSVGSTLFSPEQLAALLVIKTGDVYSQDRIRKSVQEIEDTYNYHGYYDVQVRAVELRPGEEPEVDLRLEIIEGEPSTIGRVIVAGNTITKDKVILHDARGLHPNRPLNGVEIDRTLARLRQKQLFNDPKITVQPPDPDMPGYRDVLVEIKERDTGSFNFGAAIGSDTGVFGEISLNQRNFDIADWPESFDEFIGGRAFRGAGQSFSIRLAPGDEVSEYSISFSEPHLLESDWGLGLRAAFRDRQFSVYDEERLSGSMTLSRRLGEVWTLNASTRADHVRLTAIAPFAPTAVFDAEGPDLLAGFGLGLTRNTTDTFIRPGRGTVLDLSVEQVGGDYTFTRVSGEYTVFVTITEDFLGRRSILRLNTRAAYIFGDDAPVYEKFYLGGRSFRGFEFRTISPKGIRADNGRPSDEPVGGNWLFFAGAQYEFPIFEELLNGVVFVDTGTVTDDVGFDEYRVSVGVGIRLYIAALGPVPIAFDFGFPLLKGDRDESQIFTFSAELPF